MAGLGGSSPSPDKTPEKSVVEASDVAVAIGAVGHNGSSALDSPSVMDTSPLPLLKDLGDPFGHFPVFDEVISDAKPEVLP